MTSTATPLRTHSARIREMARSRVTRVKGLHDRMEHKPAAVMCRAVNTTWRNTGVTPSDFGRVFYRQPCLWARKRPPPQPPLGEHLQPDASTPATTASDPEEADCEIGEVISYDNVGPINPASLEGYTQFLVFRDTRSKYIFAYPIKTCNEDTFLYYLDMVLRTADSNLAYCAATTTQHSAQPR